MLLKRVTCKAITRFHVSGKIDHSSWERRKLADLVRANFAVNISFEFAKFCPSLYLLYAPRMQHQIPMRICEGLYSGPPGVPPCSVNAVVIKNLLALASPCPGPDPVRTNPKRSRARYRTSVPALLCRNSLRSGISPLVRDGGVISTKILTFISSVFFWVGRDMLRLVVLAVGTRNVLWIKRNKMVDWTVTVVSRFGASSQRSAGIVTQEMEALKLPENEQFN